MKTLILFFVFGLPSFAAKACEKDPTIDYRSLYQTTKNGPLIGFDLNLNDKGVVLKILASEASCGGRSCEYAGYVKDSNGCYLRVLFFHGSIKLGSANADGLKKIITVERPEPGKTQECEWDYDISSRQMTRLLTTCKITK